MSELQTKLFSLLVNDLDAALQKMIAIGAENNVRLTNGIRKVWA